MVKNLLLMLLVVGCGMEPSSDRNHNKVTSFDGFEYYVELFKEQGLRYNQIIEIDNLVIEFSKLEKRGAMIVLGTCTAYTNRAPLIQIDPDEWARLRLSSRIILMFHELGHCILHRGHVENSFSIMNPTIISSQNFISKEYEVLAELFDESKYGSLELVGEYDRNSNSYCDYFSSGVLHRMGNEE